LPDCDSVDRSYDRGVPPARDCASDYLNLALYTFAIFAWELFVLITFDVGSAAAGLGDGSVSVFHWLITSAGWCGGAWYLLHHRPQQDGLFADPLVGSVVQRALSVAVAIAVCSGVRIAALGEWKPWAEIRDLRVDLGSAAWLGVISLFVCYVAEALVIVVLVAFAQRAGELRFGRRGVPWGGLLFVHVGGHAHLLAGTERGLLRHLRLRSLRSRLRSGTPSARTHDRPHWNCVHRLTLPHPRAKADCDTLRDMFHNCVSLTRAEWAT